MKTFFYLLVFVLTTAQAYSQNGCTDPQANNYSSTAASNDGSCTYNVTTESVTAKGPLTPLVLESSGVVFSDGFIWTHNDSGNNSNFFKVDTTNAAVVQTLSVTNFPNVDWEDIAMDSSYLYLGDCGNNNGTRTDLKVLRVSRSQFIGNTASAVSVTAEAISFSYADQTSFVSSNTHNFDCESIMPIGSSIYLFTKDRGDLQTRVYKLPKTPGTYTLSYYTSFNSMGLVTGADYNPHTHEVALIGYLPSHKNSFIYFLNDFTGDLFFSGNKRRIEIGNSVNDWQTEGIAYASASGNELFLSCESSYTPATLYTTNKAAMVAVGFQELSKTDNSLKLYPNPVNDQLQVRLTGSTSGRIIVYTCIGEAVLSVDLKESETSVDVSRLSGALYLVEFTDVSGHVAREKFIKR